MPFWLKGEAGLDRGDGNMLGGGVGWVRLG